MGEKFKYGLELCPVCGAWALVITRSSGERNVICNNLGAGWHKICQEQQALQQLWHKAHKPVKADSRQLREILAPWLF